MVADVGISTEHHHAHGPANRGRRVLKTAAPLFVRHPRAEPRAAVIVVHDIYGLTERIEDYCRALGARGCLAVAPYLYYDIGGKEFRPEDERTARAVMSMLPTDDLAAGLTGALEYLHQRAAIAPQRTGLLGVGMGGYLASWAAANHELGAAVALDPVGVEEAPWQGLPVLPELVTGLRTPWLGVSETSSLCETGALVTAVEECGSADIVPATPSGPDALGGWDEAMRFFDGRLLT